MLVDTVVSRGEFLTSYTPYQAEISQGTLTTIFEFQTMICQLTGMDVANASMYDGSTAVPEAAMMAVRATGTRPRAGRADACIRSIARCCAPTRKHQGMPVDEFGYDAETGLARSGRSGAQDRRLRPRAVIIQIAEFLRHRRAGEGGRRDRAPARRAAGGAVHRGGVAGHCWSRRADADIVAGELQSFAISPSYGGPYAGIIATKEKFIRQMPGRLVGQTTDSRGNRAFCLTLSTREQHIRREKATSNICTNQALIALMATVFMTVYGKQGLRELAEQNLAKAHYLAGKLKPRFTGPFFNEFVVAADGTTPDAINRALLEEEDHRRPAARAASIPNWPNAMLLCATEMTQARATWMRWRRRSRAGARGAHDQESPPAHHPERGAAVRAQLARQEGLPASRARCARRSMPPRRWARTTCAPRSKAFPR